MILKRSLLVPAWAEPVWHLFVIRTKNRNNLQKHLEKNGIQTLIHYPVPPHRQSAYQEYLGLNLPITERIHEEVLSLPMGPAMQAGEVEKVIRVTKGYFSDAG